MPVKQSNTSVVNSNTILALSIPPIAPGKVFPIPNLPSAPGSPAAELVLLAGLVAGMVLAGIGDEPPRARKPHKDENDKDFPDNSQVLKVFDAVEVVEDVLIRDPATAGLLGTLIVRAIISIFKVGHGVWHDVDVLMAESQKLREEVWGPLADALDKKLRAKALQQSNDRRTGIWLEGGARESPEFTFKQQFGFGHNRNFRVRLGVMHTNAKEWDR
jgi:hypothetical protein